MDWLDKFKDIEERLFPHYSLNAYERSMYYFLLSKTRLVNLEEDTIPLSHISNALKCSDFSSRKVIRELSNKMVIHLEQTRSGHKVKVFLPHELDLPVTKDSSSVIDIEDIDFFKDRKYLKPLLERENYSCFYCLKKISEENSELDHVVAQRKQGNNSYRNIVASCHQCNTTKLDNDAVDHIRNLYRKNLLSESEFEERVSNLEDLIEGSRKPNIEDIL